MATTIHLPGDLLSRLDHRAKHLGVSRNRFIVDALEQRLRVQDQWPDEVVAMLAEPASAAVTEAADEMMKAIREGRRSRKGPPEL